MNKSTDELYAEIRRLGAAIAEAPDDAPERPRLVADRDRLRQEAARRADELRHPDSIRTELERIDLRLAEIAGRRIRAASSERHLGATIQDPGAYRDAINRRLDANHAEEIAELAERRAKLTELLPPEAP